MATEDLNALYQIGGAVAVVVGGMAAAIPWVLKKVKDIGTAEVKTEQTTIITADTVAMDALAKTIEASNVLLTENNVLRREEQRDRAAMREAIEDNTKAVEHSTQAVMDARAEIRELAREMARASRS
jgi:hypothetical protein